ncbi:glutamyl-tRNA amidotransferas-like protein subunit A [Dothidotthia symphoricarpi CBS 119687]|uniref:Glutamyl-tRNA amidotransferas-like protein subunit A n=1 Tax=Dothidotthia symphoricarpi CBS 119687 TaxID=1392245 RepID=A0A6A6A7M6_9PLEO|nr:glutamyl-tRNA amidotransferas-like protein subunit A [Dothidotthia symphoricarpi CBS 119687]KAF2127982.1 glutamyl-tRNA amidotransferas-like protein subunit A [Dothidotthia symphoricarpi CBS 119687]
MSTDNGAPVRFLNYPTPTPREIPYNAPPPRNNPVVKGVALHYLANVVATVPGVAYLLWRNAGFASLRNLEELDGVDPRYDPTVISLPRPGDERIESYTNAVNLRVLPKDAKGRFYTVADFHDAYKSGVLTPTDVVERLLPLIRRDIAQRSPLSTAFMESNVELIMQAAEASTKRWKQGTPLGMLDGVPFAVKDDLEVKGYKRYIGTRHDYTEGKEVETSWCARKVEEEGAILVGKLTMHELGMDVSGNNPIWGCPKNPLNDSYYPGGSSGGAASAVASGLIPFAIGSDGGGSVRIPSNFCGLYGLKTSHGRVSVAPMPDAGKSVTVRGPLASSMADLEISYRVLAQPDPSNISSSQFSPPRAVTGPRNKILGICKPWFDRADPPVQEACESALQYLQSELGYKVVDISIPLLHHGQLAHAMTIMAEGASAHKTSIYDLTPANKVLMSVARQTPATDFLLGQRVRNMLMEHLAHLFQAYPGLVIVTPTTPNAGWPIGDGDLAYGISDANTQLKNMEYVWLSNFCGLPCIQLPVGYVNGVKGTGKVPIGLSGQAEWGSEDALIEFGFDGEKWLNEGYAGGKVRPGGWVDVLKR